MGGEDEWGWGGLKRVLAGVYARRCSGLLDQLVCYFKLVADTVRVATPIDTPCQFPDLPQVMDKA